MGDRRRAEEGQQAVGGRERQLVSSLHEEHHRIRGVRGPDQSVPEGAHPRLPSSTSGAKEQREVCRLISADAGKKFH